jgi:hypothetical protein
MPQSIPPQKNLWDLIATLGNGFLVALALVFMFWAACSGGEPDVDFPEVSQPAPASSTS